MSQNLYFVWLFIALITNPLLSHGQPIFFNNFKNAQSNLTLKGSAEINSNGFLKLTDLNSTDDIGHVFYHTPVRLTAPSSSSSSSSFPSALSFSTVFSFSIVSENPIPGGHGLAFFLSPDNHLAGALSDQYLGLTGTSDDTQFFAVEFDTVLTPRFSDIDGNHVGIDINSLHSIASVTAGYYVDGNSTIQDLNLKSGETIYAWIDYDSGQTRIDVCLSLSQQKPSRSILSFKIDLDSYLNEFMYPGFSASTSDFSSSHYIMDWSFDVNRQALPLHPANLPLPKEVKRRHIYEIVAASASVVLILLMLLSCLWLNIYKKKKTKKQASQDMSDIIEVESLHMEFNMIRAATRNFSIDKELGQGGFGHVYKGELENGQEIAVKRLSIDSGQGIEEFKTEVLLVAKLQHRNLVKLVGFCISGKEKILVYEFLPNSSLDKILFDPTKRMYLDWKTRFKIILGIAKGLLYLHEDSRLKIVHRDLKSSNVLLDEYLNPKISDFGLAKLFGIDQTQDATKTIVGTYGYMAPEYIFTGHYSVKSDVYSFGIMVLEIVSGQRNYMNRPHYGEALLHRAWRFWNESAALNLVDETLGDDYSREEVMKCIHMGLLCIQESAVKRPNMTTVVAAFGGQAIALPLPSPPGFFGATESTNSALINISVCKNSDFSELYPR